jgi:uncharacterized cupredoxin-like copper-binding protein
LLAAIRPAGQDFPVLLHVVGATVAFGGLLASVSALALARGQVRLLRLGYFSLVVVALPGWILMYLAGLWIYHDQGWNSLPSQLKDPAWLRIGFGVAEYGGLVFLAILVVGGVGIRRLGRRSGSARLLNVTLGGAAVLALAYVVAVWAMAGKPGQASAATAASGSQVGSTTGATRVTVDASEFKFVLSRTNVRHGNVLFTVVNQGKIAHDFSIDGRTTPLISPGKSSELAVSLPVGSFFYLCTVPGHAAAGMKGTLTAD